VLAGVVSLVVYGLHGVDGWLTRDLGVYSYAGQRVADGVPPYEDILNRAGPLAHALPAVGVWLARLVGGDELTTMRLLFMGFAGAAVTVIYLLGRDLFSSRRAGLVTAAAFLSFAGFIQYAADGPREKTPMTLFIVAALLAATRRRWFVSGVFVALATLCLQTAFFSTFVVVAVSALRLPGGLRLRALGRVAVGGGLVVAVTTAYFAAAGAFHAMLEGFYLINARYTTPNSPLGILGEKWDDLRTAYGPSTWVILAGFVAVVALSVVDLRESRAARRTGRALSGQARLAAYGAGMLAGLAWIAHEYDAWPDLFPLLPLCAVGLGGVAARLVAHLAGRQGLAVAVAFALAATGLAFGESVSHQNNLLLLQKRSVDAVFGALPRDARLISLEAPQPLVLTERVNPTRHQMFGSGLDDYIDDTWPGGMTGFRRWVVDQHADLITLGDPPPSGWVTAISKDYAYVGCAPDFFWYARRSLGPDKLAELRRVAKLDYSDAQGEFSDPCTGPPSDS
jgi:hypothetical protein